MDRIPRCFEYGERISRKDQTTPVVLMGYLNPVEVIGYEKFVPMRKIVVLMAVFLVDLPPEESKAIWDVLKQNEMDQIFLLHQHQLINVFSMLANQASGFVYYVSLKGVTGAATLLDTSEAAARIAKKIKA